MGSEMCIRDSGMAASENPRSHTTEIHTSSGTQQTTIPYFFLERYIPSYLAGWVAFRDGLESGTMPITIRDGRAPLVAGMAAKLSHQEGRPVKTAEVS